MRSRVTAALAAYALVLSPGLIAPADAQTPARARPIRTTEPTLAGSQTVSGRLERRDEHYVLTDADDQLQAYLIPRESLDLGQYVGQQVELNVSEPMLRSENEPSLWVNRIALATPRPPHAAERSPAERGPQPLISQIGFSDHLFHGDDPLMTEAVPAPIAVAVTDVTHACGPPGWVWVSADYLLWRTAGMQLPPLVTTSPPGTPQAKAGVLGFDSTTVLFGDEKLFTGDVNGVRLRPGLWFDRDSRIGVQGDLFSLESQSALFTAQGNASGSPILARPFFNINPRHPITHVFNPPAREDAQLISFPTITRGEIAIAADSQLQSASLALRTLLACESFCRPGVTSYSRVDLLTGYRYMELSDDLLIVEELNSLDPATLASFDITDLFTTENRFQGIDLGAIWQGAWQRFTVELLLKSAVGNVNQRVDIHGGTVIAQRNGTEQSFPAGFLALPSNSGSYQRDHWTVVPELGAVIGFQVLPKVRATVGYSLIYWNSVVRAGDQIDRFLNPDQIPPPIVPTAGPPFPAFHFVESNYWAQGLTVGLEGRW